MVCELTVVLKGEESSYRQKFLIYDSFAMNMQDPIVEQCVAEACENFKLKPEEIKIKTTMEL